MYRHCVSTRIAILLVETVSIQVFIQFLQGEICPLGEKDLPVWHQEGLAQLPKLFLTPGTGSWQNSSKGKLEPQGCVLGKVLPKPGSYPHPWLKSSWAVHPNISKPVGLGMESGQLSPCWFSALQFWMPPALLSRAAWVLFKAHMARYLGRQNFCRARNQSQGSSPHPSSQSMGYNCHLYYPARWHMQQLNSSKPRIRTGEALFGPAFPTPSSQGACVLTTSPPFPDRGENKLSSKVLLWRWQWPREPSSSILWLYSLPFWLLQRKHCGYYHMWLTCFSSLLGWLASLGELAKCRQFLL